MSAHRPSARDEASTMSLASSSDQHLMLAFVSPMYEDVALNELRDLTAARLVRPLARGTLLVSTGLPVALTVERFQERPPIFVRQVLLDVRSVPWSGEADADACAVAERCGDAGASSVAACDLLGRRHAGLDVFAASVVSHLRGAPSDHPFLVVAAPEEYYVGLVLPGAGVSGAPFWPGGRPDVPAVERFVSRSALKLCEAIGLFSIPLAAQGAALDLGAAPGGWSQVLAGHGMWVTAVDPGELDPRVASLPGVHAFRGTAQAFAASGDDQFDLIVDDMRLDARESARLLVTLRPRLRSHAAALITLKLPERAPTAIIKAALTALGTAYTVVGVRCLYFNRNEVTVYLGVR